MRIIYSLLLCFSFSSIAFASSNHLDFAIKKIIEAELPGAQVGLVLMDPNTQAVLYENNANVNFFPASTIKLFTAAAALQYLGEQFQFHTTIHYHADKIHQNVLHDNVVFKFKGDPSLSIDDVHAMVKELSAKGIKKIEGSLIVDDSVILDPAFAPGWTIESAPWYYAAPITSIILNENKINFEITAKNGQAQFRQVSTKHPKIKVIDNVKLVPLDETHHECQLSIEQGEKTLHLSGCWPKERIPAQVSFAVKNPRLLLESILKEAFAKQGIQLKNKIVFKASNEQIPAMIMRRSPNLKRILPHILSESNNVYTEAITKALGLAYGGRAAFQTGAFAISQILYDSMQIDLSAFRFEDGSGQSRYDFVSPYVTALLLQRIYKSKHYPLFKNSLSQPGKAGQLSFRLKDKNLQNRLYAKTGSANGTSALSGYLFNEHNQAYVFSMMINQSHLDYYPIKRVEDKLVRLLHQHVLAL